VLPGARFSVAAGIPGRYRHEPGVEFSVSVGAPGREKLVLSRLVDPANHPADRVWVPLEVDLSPYVGRRVGIVLETRGFEETKAPDRAYWGNPVVTTFRGPAPPLVILYLVDTLRADHLPIYGYRRDTAPNLVQFARDAVVFEQAIASSSWTKPSVASILTSLRPRDHGCLQFYSPFDLSNVTLAERLRQAGYTTGAIVANPILLGRNTGFAQGFSYFAAARGRLQAREVVDDGLAFLDRTQGLPRFLYLHTMDPHAPYNPPSPFDRLFSKPAGSERTVPPGGEETLDLEHVVAEYDGEIAYGDRQFGRLLRKLKRRRVYDQALIVFLADHGEELMERGHLGHGQTLFDEVVRVPLVVKFPGGRHSGSRIAQQVRLVDVLPTIMKSQGRAVPQGIAGRPLQQMLAGSPDERPVVFETKLRESVAYGARTGRATYIREFHPADHELFLDLVHDPLERHGRAEAPNPGFVALKRAAEEGTGRAAYAHLLRVDGRDRYELRLRTPGWVEQVEAEGLGQGERAAVSAGRREATLVLRPRPGEPREVFVRTRPHGVALQVEGTRGGRPLRGRDVRIGGGGLKPTSVPFTVPDVELIPDAFTPPAPGPPGVSIWLVSTRPGEVPKLDPEIARRLKSLGYLP
jgi:arylsulfatase A-like enzyme